MLENMLRGCALDFPEAGISIFLLWNLLITTVISLVFVWPPMKLCVVGDVELLYVGHN